ncbi:hypothetical protein J6590_009107 [Homalodisca vitripennis]|nr:hypothetical protein J6590_009107 [Homalodisca vitripennis]
MHVWMDIVNNHHLSDLLVEFCYTEHEDSGVPSTATVVRSNSRNPAVIGDRQTRGYIWSNTISIRERFIKFRMSGAVLDSYYRLYLYESPSGACTEHATMPLITSWSWV